MSFPILPRPDFGQQPPDHVAWWRKVIAKVAQSCGLPVVIRSESNSDGSWGPWRLGFANTTQDKGA